MKEGARNMIADSGISRTKF